MTKRIAIVGGGIAGIYTAWRLLQDNESKVKGGGERPFDIYLYESENQLGGRIRSQHILGTTYSAELGAMRFRRSHLLLNALLKRLGIATREFNLPSPVFYVRGRRLTSSEITSGRCGNCNAEGPFHLKPSERGMSAVDLIRYAIRGVLQAVNFPRLHQGKARQLKRKIKEEDFDNETWYYIKEYGVYQGLHLYSIGFWNLLQHFLSNEAYIMVHDVLSLESILGNWNAAEAIPWFLADFSSDQFDMVPGGLTRVAVRLGEDIDAIKNTVGSADKMADSIELRKLHTVRRVDFRQGTWDVHFEDGGGGRGVDSGYDYVVLALPASALAGLEVFRDGSPYMTEQASGSAVKAWPPPWAGWVKGHRMFKIFLLYAEPWWMGDNFPGYDTGRIFTDLPLRQIYHFSPTWMKSHGRLEPVNGYTEADQGGLAMLMASYSDEHYVSFWEPMLKPDPKLNLTVGVDQCYVQPSPKLKKEKWDEMWEQIKTILKEQPELLAKRRMVEKVHLLLTEIHGREIPHPILGIARDWDAGWHTWIVGSKPWEATIRRERVRPLDRLYLCGEAYSPEQGWIEGALKSSEQVLSELGVKEPDWLEGLHPDLAGYIDPYRGLGEEKEPGGQGLAYK